MQPPIISSCSLKVHTSGLLITASLRRFPEDMSHHFIEIESEAGIHMKCMSASILYCCYCFNILLSS